MDTSLKDLEGSLKAVESSMAYEELLPYFEKALLDFSKKATEPGFRKGKAPLDLIRKKYGESIEYSSLEDIANEVFFDYLEKNHSGIRILGTPAITDLDYKPKESFRFKVEFEVMPEPKDITYKNIELEKTEYEIDESLIEDEIKYHRYRNASREIDGQVTDDQYIITIDLQNLDEAGNLLIGQSQKGLEVYLANEQIFPEFKDAFKGIKEGETKIVESKNSEGKPGKVQVTCVKVEKLVPPELNSEFFKKVTGKDGLNTEEEFRQDIRESMQKIYDDISGNRLRNDAIMELVRLNEIPAPESLVDRLLDNYLENYKRELQGRKLPRDFDEKQFRQERRADATISTKWFLLRSQIAELENIEVTDDDIDRLAETESARFNIPKDKVLGLMKDDEDLKFRITGDKVLDMIVSNAKINIRTEKRKASDEAGS